MMEKKNEMDGRILRACSRLTKTYLLNAFNEAARQTGRRTITAEAARGLCREALVQLVFEMVSETNNAQGQNHFIDPKGLFTLIIQ